MQAQATRAPAEAQDRLVTVDAAAVRRAIGLSGMRLLVVLYRNRDREGWTQMTDAAVERVRFNAGAWAPCDDGEECMRPRQIEWARARLRHFGLSVDEDFDLVPAREQPLVLVEAWRRRIIGAAQRGRVQLPEHVAKRLALAPGWGGARPNSGGARPGAGRPRSTEPKPKRQRRRRRKPDHRVLVLLQPRDMPALLEQLDRDLAADLAQARAERRRAPARATTPALPPRPTLPPPPAASSTREPDMPRYTPDSPEERTATREVPLVLEQPTGEALAASCARLASLGIAEHELPPAPHDAPVARTPIAQRFLASMTEHECERLLAVSWRGAWQARHGQGRGEAKAAEMVRGTGAKSKAARRAAIEAMRAHDIAPASWCAWVLDFFARVCPDEPPPSSWVALSPAMINKHALRCRGDIVTGNMTIVPWATVELRMRWDKVHHGLRFCRTRQDVLELVARTLPKHVYRDLWARAQQEVELYEQDFAARMARGEWIWG